MSWFIEFTSLEYEDVVEAVGVGRGLFLFAAVEPWIEGLTGEAPASATNEGVNWALSR